MCLLPFSDRVENVLHTFFLLWLAFTFRFCPALNMILLWIYLCVIRFIMLFFHCYCTAYFLVYWIMCLLKWLLLTINIIYASPHFFISCETCAAHHVSMENNYKFISFMNLHCLCFLSSSIVLARCIRIFFVAVFCY